MKNIIYFLPLLLILSSCATQNTIKYTVASTTADCVGVAPQKCLLVKKGDAKQWTFFYSPIEGFSYEAGYEYVLSVKESKAESTPADASSIKYKLVKEVSKTAKTSDNLPPAASVNVGYQWGGRVLEVKEENIGMGAAQGKIKAVVVKLQVTHTTTDIMQPGDTIYCELISAPKIMPVVGREYVFKSNSLHPAHAKGVYFLNTDVMDLVV